MKSKTRKGIARRKRALRVRKKIKGTADCPRMSVFRSLRNLSTQFIDDDRGCTLASLSTLAPVFKEKYQKGGGTVESAAVLGELAAARAAELNIKEVVFDRGAYRYHGRVKALADACRKAGLVF